MAGFPARQIPELADTPPATQSLAGFSIDLWHGIVAPAGMDPALVARINGVFNKVLETPSVSTAISQGAVPAEAAATDETATAEETATADETATAEETAAAEEVASAEPGEDVTEVEAT